MYIAQYYTVNTETKEKIIALAVLSNCQYRTVEGIITVQIDEDETLGKLMSSEWLPWALEAGCSV